MKAHNLIAGIAAVLLTVSSLSVVSYNVHSQPIAAGQQNVLRVTTLATVQVHPTAAEMRSAALLPANDITSASILPTLSRLDGISNTERFNLLGSQLVMPYYSFGNKFGRISKE